MVTVQDAIAPLAVASIRTIATQAARHTPMPRGAFNAVIPQHPHVPPRGRTQAPPMSEVNHSGRESVVRLNVS
jgi:hypothetical protein